MNYVATHPGGGNDCQMLLNATSFDLVQHYGWMVLDVRPLMILLVAEAEFCDSPNGFRFHYVWPGLQEGRVLGRV